MKKPIPQSAGEFLDAIQDELGSWNVSIEPSEPDDNTSALRTVFRNAKDMDGLAYVAYEYGRMIVTIERGYHFDLDRLTSDRESWPWSSQLAEKEWVCKSQMELVLHLEELFKNY